MCASLLLRQQDRARLFGVKHPAVKTHYRFAVLFAGSGPLVSLDPTLLKSPALVDASQIGQVEANSPVTYEGTRHVLHLPTLHIHGLQDQGLSRHRQFLKTYFQDDSTRVVTWDGDHRIPVRSGDVARVVEQIVDIARQTGVIGGGLDQNDRDARAVL
ncbi:hypothetical protein B0A50_01491 [Salinomyces thailandicus]|uniref:Serine hydrolase domain-containing protein n=1 Tax=Salinomyces thailandicus TaxID=706561 RepID=A0A4U0UDG7_9PEZI|nr:hypothetical protein B0A50_01491 [Salinomyces thailandica]